MKRTILATMLLAAVLLSGCAWDPMTLLEPAPTQAARPGATEEPKDGENDVLNLPGELYVECPEFEDRAQGFTVQKLAYSFAVTAETDLTLTVDRKNGSISLGIQGESGNRYVYDKREFKSESDTVRLAPGTYRLIVAADCFQGVYAASGRAVA